MIKNVAIVSLSSGIIGEESIKHEVELGTKRLQQYGLNVKFMENAQKGIEYISTHPKQRAEDLLCALKDDDIDIILCASGGDDTYRLLPYLFSHDELRQALKKKIFLGFSDTTFNHFMFHKVGMNTFYGQAFLPDICELSENMLPYTKKYFEELIQTGTISKIEPSLVWYSERTKWDLSQVGVSMPTHKNDGFELLQGSSVFEGKILGGCLESIYDMFSTDRYLDTVELCERYQLFPSLQDWKGRILLLETSEEKPTPQLYRKMLLTLKKTGIFDVIHGILVGKPMDEVYFKEYKDILVKVIDNPLLPIVVNVNVGHATPRCIIPFGIHAIVDVDHQQITFQNEDSF